MYRILPTRSTILSAVILCALLMFGCSGGGSPTTPDTNPVDQNLTQTQTVNHSSNRLLWDFYSVSIDPATMEISIDPLRSALFNANVTRFMQPPASPIHMMSIEIDFTESDIANDYLVLDVTLRHPFPGANKFRGFDVRGIFMADASVTAPWDSTITHADFGAADPGTSSSEPVLLNADGYTRWWNPAEFTDYGNIFGYTEGNFAPSSFFADATLNPYKYFADELDAEDPLDLNPDNRGTFSLTPGFNTRRYEIQFAGTPWRYNYAIDASWAEPDAAGEPDYGIEWYPTEANCQEAYKLVLDDTNSTAYYINDTVMGGSFVLDLEIYDWQADTSVNPSAVLDEIGSVWVQSPVFDFGGSDYIDLMTTAYTWTNTGPTSASFQFTVDPVFAPGAIDAPGDYPVMIAVESGDAKDYMPQIGPDGENFTYPEEILAAYLGTTINVSGINPQNAPVVLSVVPDEGLQDMMLTDVEIHGEYFVDGATVEFSHSTDPFAIGPMAATYVSDELLLVDLDLTGAELGLYDVTVQNPDLQSGTLEDGFEVTDMIPTLVLEDEFVFTPTNAGFHCYTPAIIVELDEDITIAYEEWMYDGSSNTSYASAVKSSDGGDTWPEWAWSFASWGWHHHGDCVKIFPSSHNTSWRTLNLIDPDEITWATGFFATTFPGPSGNGEYAHVSHYIFHANEILQDDAGYAYAIGDQGGYLHYKRSETPDCLNCGPSGSVWSNNIPDVTIVTPGTLSKARSSALYSGTMYLAYFEDGNNIVKMASSVDGNTWNFDTIWDGAGSGTSGARDPGLQVDDTGWHVTFVRVDDTSGMDELCYTYSADGTTWTTPVVIRVGTDMILDSPVIRYDWDDQSLSTLGTVWWEGDYVYASFSLDDGATWSDPVLVSEMYDESKQGDVAISDLTDDWHFTYSTYNPTSSLWEIHYRRAYMEMQ